MPAFSAQTTRKPHKKFQPRSFNLNLILWVSFSVFTIVVIAFFAVVQNVQIKYQYRAQTEQSLRDAGDEIVRYAETDDVFFQSVDLSRRLLAIANRYNVSVYLFTADGGFVFPEFPVEEREEYAAIYEEVRSRLGEGPSTPWTSKRNTPPSTKKCAPASARAILCLLTIRATAVMPMQGVSRLRAGSGTCI